MGAENGCLACASGFFRGSGPTLIWRREGVSGRWEDRWRGDKEETEWGREGRRCESGGVR